MIEVNSRYMRILIFYDIYETEEVDKLAKKFRENLISLGYFMIQYSIYCKCIGSHTMYDYEIKKIRKILPLKANVRILLLSEKQYQNMVIISGEKNLNEIYNDREDYIEI
ncbi:CRISPR-associated endonuclease Cas2 [[Mycoplasma] imitans]|uniref:CRISPR-associated endonuclease Cas2 n=1 Tax=[Mycoplasma] imitans TaxID=29560 RepID=UPI000483287D|nr:CRISPR-associated endonuclease Cas2 [[Mycoplasma] imitans]